MSEAIAKFTADNGQEVTVTPEDVRSLVCPQATPQELALFVAYCQTHRLDPIGAKDAYLIKYGNGPASMVTNYQVFNRRARKSPDYRGIESGVVVLGNDQKVHHKPGSAVYGWEQLLGGWARVHVAGWEVPVYAEANLSDYSTGRSQWAKMPGVMIEKVAKSVAWRTAYPEEFGGMYSTEEMGQARAERPAPQPEACHAPGDQPVEPDEVEAAPDLLAPVRERFARWRRASGLDPREAERRLCEVAGVERMQDMDEGQVARVCRAMDGVLGVAA